MNMFPMIENSIDSSVESSSLWKTHVLKNHWNAGSELKCSKTIIFEVGVLNRIIQKPFIACRLSPLNYAFKHMRTCKNKSNRFWCPMELGSLLVKCRRFVKWNLVSTKPFINIILMNKIIHSQVRTIGFLLWKC